MNAPSISSAASAASVTYVILTSSPGQYRTEATEGVVPLDAYDYLYGGRHIATFVIAMLTTPTKIRVIDEVTPDAINLIPSKFFEKFGTPDAAFQALQVLTGNGRADVQLIRR
ncbi:hypothetical protein [Paraburkholderia sp.]|uniref:hypothetical protein n=1 Tax=Paraburkholderia sp. TaxID=1926495 RepID=UPI0039E42B44